MAATNQQLLMELLAERQRRGRSGPSAAPGPESLKLTKEQGQNVGFGNQMKNAEEQFQRATEAGYDSGSGWQSALDVIDNAPGVGGVLSKLTPFFRGAAGNQARAAKELWLENNEKMMTGLAAKGGEERRNPRIYFPQAGEDQTTYENKERTRATQFGSALSAAGPGARDMGTYWKRTKLAPEQWQALPPAQLKAAQAFSGSKDKPGRKGNPYVPRGAEDMKGVKFGDWFVTPTGALKRKDW